METVQQVWSKTKLLVKALIIGMIILILQIPTFYVRELIEERETRQKEAIAEVSGRWAARQNIAGPLLVLPYYDFPADTLNAKKPARNLAYFLPEELQIQSEISPEKKYRGIYKVLLYTSKHQLSGNFQNLSLEKLDIRPERVAWNEAFLKINIADTKGLNEDVKLLWNQRAIPATTDAPIMSTPEEGVYAPLPLTGLQDLQKTDFSIGLSLSGSEQLLFTPVGKSTTVSMKAKWPHPSFTGDILPLTSDIRTDSFSAQWKSVAQKRNFPQQWKNNAYGVRPGISNGTDTIQNNITDAAFGTNLFVPVNDYQKTMRSIKYAALCILLTFAAFFIIETTNKKSVHPFQYGLIGVALVLFYTLLLSFSEYVGFNLSYIISAACTIGLITWFVKGILASSRLSMILSIVLMLVYTYVFTILQLQDYSLILGSIGLFITLAVIMHFSKKIQW
ncbi:MAG: cell envelope integrity protein CreD [Flavisolibacter sp.]